MKIIGIDPGINNTGIAVSEDGKIKEVYLISRKGKHGVGFNICDQCCKIKNIFRKELFSTVAVEFPRIYPNSPERHNDIVDLAAMAGALTQALSYGTLILPYPRDWKGTVPKKIHNERILKKIPELEVFLKPYPKTKHEHIIDAAGLALWCHENQRTGKR